MLGDLTRRVEEVGGGAVLAYYELFPKLAYLAEMAADATSGSDHHTVVAKLAKPGPTFTVRPLPIVEGARVENTGVKFPKDPEFMQLFVVEGEDAKAIGKWLKRSMREALCEYPDVWLHVRGRAMEEVPTLRMLALSPEEVGERAERLVARLRAEAPRATVEVIDGTSRPGGGSSPAGERPTRLIALAAAGVRAERLEAALRDGDPPVIARVQEGRVLLDLRTVPPEEDGTLAACLVRLLGTAP